MESLNQQQQQQDQQNQEPLQLQQKVQKVPKKVSKPKKEENIENQQEDLQQIKEQVVENSQIVENVQQQMTLEQFEKLSIEEKLKIINQRKTEKVNFQKKEGKKAIMYNQKIINYDKFKIVVKIPALNCLAHFDQLIPDLSENFIKNEFSSKQQISFIIFVRNQKGLEDKDFDLLKNDKEFVQKFEFDSQLRQSLLKKCYYGQILVQNMQKTKEMKYQLFDNVDKETKKFAELIDSALTKYTNLVLNGEDTYNVNVQKFVVNEIEKEVK